MGEKLDNKMKIYQTNKDKMQTKMTRAQSPLRMKEGVLQFSRKRRLRTSQAFGFWSRYKCSKQNANSVSSVYRFGFHAKKYCMEK